jgi:hypothetical protein
MNIHGLAPTLRLVADGHDEADSQPDDGGGDVVRVGESRWQRDGLFAFLAVAFALALFRGLAGAHTTGGRIAVSVVMGGLLVLVVALWLNAVRRPSVLEVASERIHLVNRAKKRSGDLVKSQGSEVGLVARRSGRYFTLLLRQSSTTRSLPLPLFSRRAVAHACRAQGWEVLERTRRSRRA